MSLLDYPFAKFNIKNEPIMYNVVEYNVITVNDTLDEENGWNKIQTDLLFDLINIYGLRW